MSLVSGLSEYIISPGTEKVLIGAGAGVALASIPFFAASLSNKKKALLLFKQEHTLAGAIKTGNLNYTAIGLSMQF